MHFFSSLKLNVLKVVQEGRTSSFLFAFIGNLYTRQVQIEGETLAIQVQDTPGIQVRSSETLGERGAYLAVESFTFSQVPHAAGAEKFAELHVDLHIV